MEHLLLQSRKLNLLKGKVIPKKSQEESTHMLYDIVDRIPFIDFSGVKFDLFEDKLKVITLAYTQLKNAYRKKLD